MPEAGNGKSMYLYRCPAKLQKADFAGFQKDGMCVLRQTQNKSFRILDLLSPCRFQSFPAIFQENSGGPHLKLEAHLPAMDDNTIQNSPEGPADQSKIQISQTAREHRPPRIARPKLFVAPPASASTQ